MCSLALAVFGLALAACQPPLAPRPSHLQKMDPPAAGLQKMAAAPSRLQKHDPGCAAIDVLPHLDRYDCHIRKALRHHAQGVIAPANIKAQIEVESDGRMDIVSPAGAVCAMQLLPSTFDSMLPGGDIHAPADCVRAGVKYRVWCARFWHKGLRSEDERYGPLSLGCYNAGPGGMLSGQRRCGGYDFADFAPCLPVETRNYPVRIAGLEAGKPRAFWRHPGER